MERNNVAPKGSWLDENGKRWIKVAFDVMADNGSRFIRQVQVTLQMQFSFSAGRYIVNLDQGTVQEIIRQYPSLASVRCPSFIPTANRIFH